jgi:hypothetical protein
LGGDAGDFGADKVTAHGFSFGDLARIGVGTIAGIGNILGGKSTAQKVGGGISVAGGALSGIAKGLDNKTLGAVGSVLGGTGLVVSGISQGGLGGAAQAALGGAQIGAVLGGPIGAAIGAAAGFASGLIGGLFGHKGPSAADIQKAIRKETINPDQFVGIGFERSAQGSFVDTLNSGFLEGPGGTFSNFQLSNRPRQSPISVNFNINAIDSKNVKDFLDEHGPAIAQQVASQTSSVRSGLGVAVRQAVHPA